MASICGRETWSSAESFCCRSLLILVALEATVGVLGSATPRFDVFRFIEQPSDTVVERDQPAVLNCSAYLQGSSQMPQIRWLRDDVVMNFDQGNRSRRQKLSNGSLYFMSIEHSRSHQPDEGTYQCVASVPELGSIVSRKAKLQVAYLSRNFAELPKSLQVHLGDTAMFSCGIEGIPKPSIRWYKDGVLIGPDDANYYIHMDGVLEISSAQFSDFGRYKCRTESMKRTRVSENVMLTQDSDVSTYEGVPPRLLIKPKDTVALEGDTVVLHCAANGRDRQKQRPTISWLRNGITIDMANLQSRFSLEGQGSMRVDSVNEGDTSTYTCRATNMEDSVDAEVTLTVHVPPTFRKRPHNQYAHTKGDVEFQCDVHGMPEPTVRWIKNGDVLIPSEYFQIVDGHNLRILGLLNTDDGMYQCFAENAIGNTQSSAQLIITHPGYSTSMSPDPPTPPTRLIAAIVSKRFVTLSWQAPYHAGSSDVTGYSVFWRENGSNRERELNTTTLEANIQHLKPATRYRFKVIAHNAAGAGQRGAQITVETQSEVHVPGPPLNLRVEVLSPTAMKITWDPPAKTTGYITKYKLVYFEEGTEGPGEDDVEVNGHSHVLTALKIFRQYSFRVVAYNSNGPGDSAEEVTARSYSDVPSKPPQNVSLETDSSNSIIVNWEPPPLEAQNGLITGYKIRYKRKGARKGDTVTTDGNRRSYALTELERNTHYQFRIQALNVNGSSSATQWHYAETFMHDLDESTVPGQPTSLQVRPLTNSIVVSWTPPREQDIMIRGYVLSYGIGSPYVYKQVLDTKQRYHTIHNLRPSSEYVISLRAYNNIGEGLPIYETVTTRQESSPEPLTPMIPPVGLQAVVLSSSTILLTWSDTSLGRNQRITDHRYYTVRYTAKSARRPRSVNSTDLNAHIDELKPNTEYEFSVKVIKGRRQSTWSLSVFNKTFEDVPTTAPRDLTAVAVEGRPAWISLSWQPPRYANGQITGYLVFYTTDMTQPDRDWVVDGIPGDKLSKIIRDLTPETTYYFKLQARNSKGYSPMSPTVIFATPKSDGTGGGKIEIPVGQPNGPQNGRKGSRGQYDYSVIASRNKDRETKNRQSNGIPPLILWVSIGCVTVITLLAVLIVTGILCKRRMADSERRKRSSAYMSASKGKMKPVPTNDRKPPPDLWMELKNMDKGGQDGAVTTTGRNSQDMKAGEEGSTGNPPNYDAYEEDRYRRTPVRPKPIMIPVDQPPPPREPIATAVPNGQVSGGDDMHARPVYPRTQYSMQYASTPRVHAGDSSQPNSEEHGRSTWERRKAKQRRHSNSNSNSKLPGPQSPNSPTYQNQQQTPIPYDRPGQTGTLPSAAVVSAAQPPPGDTDGTQSLPRHPQHPLKSFSVPGPPPSQGSTPNTPSPPKHIVKPTPQITAYKKPSPPTGSNNASCTTPANCRTPVPVVTPMAPDVTMKNNRDDSMHKSYSTEELTAEMANLEGLMKDLTAITQQEFEC